jgi:alpha-beta hydrolase superfamily lysophospholipase
MHESTVQVPTRDGITLQVWRWAPEGEPRAVVQIHHGLGEHGGRYRRFGRALTEVGYLVYAADGRASGRTAQGRYGDWGPDGWQGWVDDIHQVNAAIRAANPGMPIALVAHSLGSFGAQHYLLAHADEVESVVLSGTSEVTGIADMMGGDEPAELSSLNGGFEHRTGFEWLSRDDAEVDAYMADPANGWAWPPNVIPGVGSVREAADPARLRSIRPDLPILLVSGDMDPIAAGGDAVRLVAQRYREAGLADVEVILYPGARHEVLNETNRDEVTADILAFLDRTLA